MSECNCDVPSGQCRCAALGQDCGCAEAREKIEDLLRNELCAEDSKPIRNHIANCPDCLAEQHACEALTVAVQRGCDDKAPAQLRAAILLSLEHARLG